MLTHLIIRNFAIIDELEIAFREGLTVVTGETGAGKSILVNALNLVLGGRASVDVIRSHANEAVVEAIFEPNEGTWARISPLMEARGIDTQEQLLIVRRIVNRTGRNKVFVNGCAVSVSSLRGLARGLVDISGQHEHYSLLDESTHVLTLDAFAGLDERRESVEEAVERLRALEREVRQLQSNEQARLTQIDFLRFQLDEIDAAELDPDEEEALQTEMHRLRNAEQLRDMALGARYQLYDGEHAVVDTVSQICHDLERAASMDVSLGEVHESLESARIQLSEAASELRSYAQDIESDPRQLAQVEARVEKIERLKRKHGGDLGAVILRADSMRAELERLERAEERIDEAVAQRKALEKVVLAQARTLSERRKEAARRLTELVESELAVLGMAGCRFEVVITHSLGDGEVTADATEAGLAALGPYGMDLVAFAIAPNRGEEPKPMARIASGGELSRIMLAIKSGLLMTDTVESYVFDEIDSGIGGSVAEVVGRKIKEVARNRQVICITHLAQIASFGDWHMVVEKVHHTERTVSSIRQLAYAERVGEVARMLGGVTITPKTMAHAEEMISAAADYHVADVGVSSS